MSSIQCKDISHSKKQENIGHNQRKNHSIGTEPEMTKIVKLLYKNIKIAIINVLHMFKKVEKNMSIIRRKLNL